VELKEWLLSRVNGSHNGGESQFRSSRNTASLVIVKMIIVCCLISSGYVPTSGFLLVNHCEGRQ